MAFQSSRPTVSRITPASPTSKSRAGLTAGIAVTRRLEAFIEWDAFYPTGTTATGPQHYAVGGFVYFITKNVAVDIRTGVGLNKQANDVLAGTGFAVRY